jgi:hypothetical protein
MQEGQQWCLQCGAGQPGSLGESSRSRPMSTMALIAALLVAGAAVAGAAALKDHKTAHSAPRVVALVPGTTTPAGAAPTTTTPAGAAGATTPAAPGIAKTPTAPGGTASNIPHSGKTGSSGTGSSAGASNFLFPSAGKAPKIPSPTATPKAPTGSTGAGKEPTTTPAETKPSEPAGKTGESKANSGPSTKAEQATPILLDTNAATTYNPYDYPAAGFGDPALAIDGETSTAWTAQVQPSAAPRMAEGLLIDLRSPMKLGAVKLHTTTPGMTIQLYGATGHKAPATITEPGWTPLSSSHVLKKKTTNLKLHSGAHQFRFVVVWIVKAPAASVGTPQAPGHVSLNEVELLPPAS